jgi:uncharacterized protein (DUF58 family)
LAAEPSFPLISRRRGTGLIGGTRRSVHRGGGFEIVSSRTYRRGDSVRSIDWKASARMSSARHADDFIVREHFAEDRPRVVLVVDRRPSMSLYLSGLPWLHKPAAVVAAGRMIVESALAAQGYPGYLDFADAHEPRWLPPNRRENAAAIRETELTRSAYTAPPDALLRSLRHLQRARADVPAGSFVFVLSDFLAPPDPAAWRVGLALGWDLVPVIVQDATWEQSFPAVSGFLLPLEKPVRLTRREVDERREANERRLAELAETFGSLEIDPVLLSSAEPLEVFSAFMHWHERRRERLTLR